MRNSFLIAAFLAFVAGGAMAQTGTSPPPAQNGPQNSAINSSSKAVEAPVKGRNSFTEGEAKSRIEKAGFSASAKKTPMSMPRASAAAARW
jgi:hypothetical protein